MMVIYLPVKFEFDDTTLILNGSQSSLQAALNTIEIFGSFSGLHMNTNKTKVIWIGRKKYSKDKLKVSVKLDWGTTQFKLLGIIFSVDLQEMIALNYSKALDNSKQILTLWNKRNLTPFGTITVIKTFILSRFNHIFMIIPSPDKHFFKEINSCLFAFLWGNKPDKIKRDYITQDYRMGGLRMVNIELFAQSLKLTWMNKLFKSEPPLWLNLFENTISPVSKIASYGSTWCDILRKKTQNQFWKEILTSWVTLCENIPIRSNTEILSTLLWYSPKISKAILNLPNWSKQGIIVVGDLLDNRGNIISQTKLEDKYTHLKMNFLEYLRIKSCVESYVKKYKKDGLFYFQQPCLPTHLLPIFSRNSGSKHYYNILNKPVINMNCKIAWNTELNLNIDEITWQQIFRICSKLPQHHNLIWFQYRILHRILGTRTLLAKIDKATSPDCFLCKSAPETIFHIFSQCPDVLDFWKNVRVWVKNKTGLSLDLGRLEYILGYLNTDTNSLPINILLVATKYYIYSNSRLSKTLYIPELLEKIKSIYDEQKLVATLEFKQETFNKTWRLIKLLID